jgi:hypothetical protein
MCKKQMLSYGSLSTLHIMRSVRILIFTDVDFWCLLFILTETQLKEKMHKWLSPPDPSKNQNIARKSHHKGTASWFFQGSIFEEWKQSSSLLWIHGKRTSLFFSATQHSTNSSVHSGVWQERPVVCYFLLMPSRNNLDYRSALGSSKTLRHDAK